MFFILRAVFWLSLALVLVPAEWRSAAEAFGERTFGTPTETSASVERTVGAAQAKLHELDGFCDRNPITCAGGRIALDGIGREVEAGARAFVEPSARPTAATPSTQAAAHSPSDRPVPLPIARPLS